MEVDLLVVADEVAVGTNRKLGILGVFTEILPQTMPWTVSNMHLVVFFDANVAEVGTQKVLEARLQDVDGRVLVSDRHTHLVPPAPRPGSKSRFAVIYPFVNVRFDDPGDYEFAVLVGGDTKRTLPLYVHEPLDEDESEQGEA